MLRRWIVLVVLVRFVASGQAPTYSAADIVNASDFAPGPFAPNSVLSIFGANLAWSTRALVAGDIAGSTLPTKLGSVEVYVDNWPAPLLYVSPTQINFIIPGNQIAGAVGLRVVRESVSGPPVTLVLVDAAPALFAPGPGYVISTHADGALLTADSPAHGGELVVVYATGLGQTRPNPSPGVLPQTAASIAGLPNLQVLLDGVPMEAFRIKYAGVTPLSAGLYQLNLELPPVLGVDPEIRVLVGSQSSPAGLRIPVR